MSREPREATSVAEPELPRLTRWLRPVVDAAARINFSVHRKLLFGFLIGAVLLVGMAILSFAVIGRMSDRVGELNRLQAKASGAQQMLYLVTAQSHNLAMAILTKNPAMDSAMQHEDYPALVSADQRKFGELLDSMERANPGDAEFLQGVRKTNAEFSATSTKVLALYQAGDYEGAAGLHIAESDMQSHDLEDRV